MSFKKAIKIFKTIVPTINPKYRAYADQVIELFKERKIEKTKEAEKILQQLGGRGVAPQTAISKINSRYIKAEPATGKLTRAKEENYFISGTIQTLDI